MHKRARNTPLPWDAVVGFYLGNSFQVLLVASCALFEFKPGEMWEVHVDRGPTAGNSLTPASVPMSVVKLTKIF